MSIFTMPSLGADMEAGKLVEWLVKPGDQVKKGDVVAVVETQKGAIEIEIFQPGRIEELIAEVGQTLPVGAPLARLASEGEMAPSPSAPQPPVAPQSAAPSPPPAPAPIAPAAPSAPPPASSPPTAAAGMGPVLASPAARARAVELGVDLGAIPGSGPGGAVLLADVEQAATHLPAEPPAPTGKPGLDMAEMRRAIATAMSRSKREIPHYYLTHEIDLQAAQERLTAVNADRTPDRRLLLGALLVRATVGALAKVPELNGRFEADPFTPAAAVHCGLAIAMRGGGLIAPAILDAQAMDVDAIMDAMRDLVARTRTGRLRNSEITQGTITVSSLGETGVDALTGVIYPPQVALVGFGTPRLKPVVLDGAIVARLSVTATLAADHRISDGRRGAQFLGEIARLLQEPDIP
ncbi:dihydrolipoamide acetyltransferase family protein [Tabrizicola caldifontis]|uniref:dihydrolipoamide acetyltransferase family protein n=1 Tax=Tabrizicola caldifontis TaxID=2528036 RepID=UPI00107FF977|nr:dihydrolipoamide acetyltransferase family protein [Rhodobacter sp. YIM 73028]